MSLLIFFVTQFSQYFIWDEKAKSNSIYWSEYMDKEELDLFIEIYCLQIANPKVSQKEKSPFLLVFSCVKCLVVIWINKWILCHIIAIIIPKSVRQQNAAEKKNYDNRFYSGTIVYLRSNDYSFDWIRK
jgi:hypothetical protein